MTRLALALCLCVSTGASAARLDGPVGDFRLLDRDGRSHELYRLSRRRAVVLTLRVADCAPVASSIQALRRVQYRAKADDVPFFLIAASSDGLGTASLPGLDAPILADAAGIVTSSLGLESDGETLIIDPARWNVVFRGRAARAGEALDDFLAGRPVKGDGRAADGCRLSAEETRIPSYEREIAPLVRRRYQRCHAAAEGIAPLTSHASLHAWAPAVRESLLTGRMPPWGADKRYGPYADDPSLAPEELSALVRWIDAGSPRGSGDDPLLQPLPQPPWELGPPDIVLEMDREAVISSSGGVTYRYFQLGPPLERELLLRAVEIRPSNTRLAHHAIVFAFPKPYQEYANLRENPSSGQLMAIRPPGSRFVWNWTHGRRTAELPEGTAIRVPKGRHLTLEIHYDPTGRPERDRTQVGLYLYRGGKPPRDVKFQILNKRDVRIPPRTREHLMGPYEAFRFERAAALVSFRPHMHQRGARMRAVAELPDGKKETLLSIPRFDSKSQLTYMFETPRVVPAGTRVWVDGAYDNSADNPVNPDPDKAVSWGLTSDDEMFLLILSYFDADG